MLICSQGLQYISLSTVQALCRPEDQDKGIIDESIAIKTTNTEYYTPQVIGNTFPDILRSGNDVQNVKKSNKCPPNYKPYIESNIMFGIQEYGGGQNFEIGFASGTRWSGTEWPDQTQAPIKIEQEQTFVHNYNQLDVLGQLISFVYQFETSDTVYDFNIQATMNFFQQGVNPQWDDDINTFIVSVTSDHGEQIWVPFCRSWLVSNTVNPVKKKRILAPALVLRYEPILPNPTSHNEPFTPQVRERALTIPLNYKDTQVEVNNLLQFLNIDEHLNEIKVHCLFANPDLFKIDTIELVFTTDFEAETFVLGFQTNSDFESTFLSFDSASELIEFNLQADWPTEPGHHAALLYKNSLLGTEATVRQDIIVCKFSRISPTPQNTGYNSGQIFKQSDLAKLTEADRIQLIDGNQITSDNDRIYFDKVQTLSQNDDAFCGEIDSQAQMAFRSPDDPEVFSENDDTNRYPYFSQEISTSTILDDFQEYMIQLRAEHMFNSNYMIDFLYLTVANYCRVKEDGTDQSHYYTSQPQSLLGYNEQALHKLPVFEQFTYDTLFTDQPSINTEQFDVKYKVELDSQINYEDSFYTIDILLENMIVCPVLRPPDFVELFDGFYNAVGNKVKIIEHINNGKKFYQIQFEPLVILKEFVEQKKQPGDFQQEGSTLPNNIQRKSDSIDISQTMSIILNFYTQNIFQVQHKTLAFLVNPHKIELTKIKLMDFYNSKCDHSLNDLNNNFNSIFKIKSDGIKNAIVAQNASLSEMDKLEAGFYSEVELHVCSIKQTTLSILNCELLVEDIQLTRINESRQNDSSQIQYLTTNGPVWNLDPNDADYDSKVDLCNQFYSVKFERASGNFNAQISSLTQFKKPNQMQVTFLNPVCAEVSQAEQFEFLIHVDYNELDKEFVYTHPDFKLTVTNLCQTILPTQNLHKILGAFNDSPAFRKDVPQEIILTPGQNQYLNLGEVYDPQNDQFFVKNWTILDESGQFVPWVDLVSISSDKTIQKVLLNVEAPKQAKYEQIAIFSIQFKDVKTFMESKESPIFQIRLIVEGFEKDQTGQYNFENLFIAGKSKSQPIQGFVFPISNTGGITFKFSEEVNLKQDLKRNLASNLSSPEQSISFINLVLVENQKKYDFIGQDFSEDINKVTWTLTEFTGTNFIIKVRFPSNLVISPSKLYKDSLVINLLSTELFEGKRENGQIEFKQFQEGKTNSIQFDIPPQISEIDKIFVEGAQLISKTSALMIGLQLSSTLILFSPLLQFVFGMINTFQIQIILCLFEMQAQPENIQLVLEGLMMIVSADIFDSEGWFQAMLQFSETDSLTEKLENYNFQGRTFVLLAGSMLTIFVILSLENSLHYVCSMVFSGQNRRRAPKFLRTFVQKRNYSAGFYQFLVESSLDIGVCSLISLNYSKNLNGNLSDKLSQLLCYAALLFQIGGIVYIWRETNEQRIVAIDINEKRSARRNLIQLRLNKEKKVREQIELKRTLEKHAKKSTRNKEHLGSINEELESTDQSDQVSIHNQQADQNMDGGLLNARVDFQNFKEYDSHKSQRSFDSLEIREGGEIEQVQKMDKKDLHAQSSKQNDIDYDIELNLANRISKYSHITNEDDEAFRIKTRIHPQFTGIKKVKNALYQPLIYIARRYVLVGVIMWGQYSQVGTSLCAFQVIIYFTSASLVVLFYIEERPFKNQLKNRVEIMNECFVFLAGYHLFCFTNFMQDRSDVAYMGQSFIAIFILNLSINIALMLHLELKAAKLSCKTFVTNRNKRINKTRRRQKHLQDSSVQSCNSCSSNYENITNQVVVEKQKENQVVKQIASDAMIAQIIEDDYDQEESEDESKVDQDFEQEKEEGVFQNQILGQQQYVQERPLLRNEYAHIRETENKLLIQNESQGPLLSQESAATVNGHFQCFDLENLKTYDQQLQNIELARYKKVNKNTNGEEMNSEIADLNNPKVCLIQPESPKYSRPVIDLDLRLDNKLESPKYSRPVISLKQRPEKHTSRGLQSHRQNTLTLTEPCVKQIQEEEDKLVQRQIQGQKTQQKLNLGAVSSDFKHHPSVRQRQIREMLSVHQKRLKKERESEYSTRIEVQEISEMMQSRMDQQSEVMWIEFKKGTFDASLPENMKYLDGFFLRLEAENQVILTDSQREQMQERQILSHVLESKRAAFIKKFAKTKGVGL